MTRSAAQTIAETAPGRTWSILRLGAWALIGLGAGAFLVASDWRTGWVVGDTGPLTGQESLPRIGAILLMTGLALLSWHQLRARRHRSPERYRGPSILALVGLSIGLSVALPLPVRDSINLLFSGGRPDWPPILIWSVSSQIAVLLVGWFAVLRPRGLEGIRLFADARPIPHAALGVAAGMAAWAGGVAILALLTSEPIRVDGRIEDLTLGVPVAIGLLAVVALTPFAEEVFFRGIVLEAWRREYGAPAALAGSAVLFGLAHVGLNPTASVPGAVPDLAIIGAYGLLLGILALRTGSLVAPMAAHAALNLMPFVAVAALG